MTLKIRITSFYSLEESKYKIEILWLCQMHVAYLYNFFLLKFVQVAYFTVAET